MSGRHRAVRLLLDEMFSPRIADELRARGHDVLAVAADPQLRAMTDAELFAWAAQQGRRVVTENVRDFRPLVADLSSGPGVLFTSSRSFPRRTRGLGVLITALDAWLVAAQENPPPVEGWLVRPQP